MHQLSKELANRAADVACRLMGKPSSRTCQELRFGRRGSLAVVHQGAKQGVWHDHETGEGGDMLSLITRELNLSFPEALEVAEELLGGTTFSSVEPRVEPRATNDMDAEARRAAAAKTWSETTMISGTAASVYLESRGLNVERLQIENSLRWHAGIRALVALMTDPVTGEACGIHRTYLDDDCRKLSRKMLGKQGVVRICPDDEVVDGLGICEGIEDALAITLAGWRPIWAATSAGAIARFAVLQGVNALTIFADSDPAGRQAANACTGRWRESGRDTSIVDWSAAHA